MQVQTLTEQEDMQIEKIGIIQLVTRMLSLRTLPHIVAVALLSSVLMLFVNSNEEFVAMSFISLALSYLFIGMLSNNDRVTNLITLDHESIMASPVKMTFMGFKITILPLALSALILIIMWNLLGGSENKWISPGLAMLFIGWSIGQAVSFRTGIVEWLKNGLGDAKLHTYREKLSIASQVIIVQGFALIIIWLGQIASGKETTFIDALISGIIFIIISIALQMLTLWLTRDERESAGAEKGLASFSFKWMIVAQLFITWHAFSAYRRYFMEPSTISTLIEEITLMAFTVLFAVWSLTTYTVGDGKRLVSEKAALPIAISFGYAYAGSVSMLAGTFGSLKEVILFGHLLTIATTIAIINSTLRKSRKTSGFIQKAKTVEISREDASDNEKTNPENDEESWQEQKDVDWEKGDDIGDGTNWENDIEVLD